MERLLHLRNEMDTPVDLEDALYRTRQSHTERAGAKTSHVDLVASSKDANETTQGTRRKTLLELGWELERLVADKRLGESPTSSTVPREDQSDKARERDAQTLLQDTAESRLPLAHLNGDADAHQSPLVSLHLAVASKADAPALVSTGRVEIDLSALDNNVQDVTSPSASAMSVLQPLLRA